MASQELFLYRLRIYQPRAREDVVDALFDVLPSLQQRGLRGEVMTMFLGQMLHESMGFSRLEEIASGQAYEGRKDLGNTQPGDGVRYKGRGIIQLTGRYNYKKFGNIAGVDLENNPHLAADPSIAVKVATDYWFHQGCQQAAEEGDYKKVTRLINGGYNGMNDREIWRIRSKKLVPFMENDSDFEDL